MTETEPTYEPEPTYDDEPTPAAPVAAAVEPSSRRGRGDLELDIKAVTDAFSTGTITLAEGEHLTPHRIATKIGENGAVKPPSSGAVSACLKRWYDVGYIAVNEKPFAFLGYTDAAVHEGLAALKAQATERKRAARTAAEPTEVSSEA